MFVSVWAGKPRKIFLVNAVAIVINIFSSSRSFSDSLVQLGYLSPYNTENHLPPYSSEEVHSTGRLFLPILHFNTNFLHVSLIEENIVRVAGQCTLSTL